MINTLTEKYVVSVKAFKMAKKLSKDAERLYLKNFNAAKLRCELRDDADRRVLAKLLLSLDQGLAVSGITQPSDRVKNRIVTEMLELQPQPAV